MQDFQRLPFGDWLPDFPTYNNPGAIEARNCLPVNVGYRELRSFVATSPSLPSLAEPIVGATWGSSPTGTISIIIGTATRLLRLAGGTWTVIGSGYTAVSNWEFVRFGVNVIAVASGVDPQVIDLSAGSPTATALGGSPPRAARVAAVSDFVVFGDLDSNSNTVQWSGYNNPTIWDTLGDPLYQAGSQTLDSGGAVQKIVGGRFGYIFSQNEVRVMRYVGQPVLFSILPLDRERGLGTPAPNSVVTTGQDVYFYSQDGFFRLRGGSFQNIGQERVNRWFLDEVDRTQIETMRGSVDRTNQLVFWCFRSNGAIVCDRMLIYNYAVDRWSYADTSPDAVFELRSEGYNVDTLDNILTDVDSTPILLDTTAFLGGQLSLFGSDATGRIGTFDGAALQAIIDTSEYDGGGNTRKSTASLRPLVEGSSTSSIALRLLTRDTLQQALVTRALQQLNTVGEAPATTNARYSRVRVEISGGFTHAVGVDVIGNSTGRY